MCVIKNNDVAQYISNVLNSCNADLDKSVAYVQEHCTEEEFIAYRRLIGKIMGEVVIEGLMPLYKQHPEIDPDN